MADNDLNEIVFADNATMRVKDTLEEIETQVKVCPSIRGSR